MSVTAGISPTCAFMIRCAIWASFPLCAGIKMMMDRVRRAGLLAHSSDMTITMTGASILLSVGGRLSTHPRAGAMWRRCDGTAVGLLRVLRKAHRNGRKVLRLAKRRERMHRLLCCRKRGRGCIRRGGRTGGLVMAELKRCPFCGGEAILETVDGNSPQECYIYCPECDFESGVYSEPKFIVEKWNRRAENG